MARPSRLGFRILPSPPRLDAELVSRFRGLASSNLADAMGRFNFMDPAIAGRSGVPLCGLAVTVNARPADNLMVHKALEVAMPGDVVVVNTGGNSSAVFGGLMCASAAAKGLGGIVVDGAIRDVDEIVELQFPAYSRSLSPGGCDKDGPGEINVPISCGGVVVQAGDVVVGDRDGVAVVPRDHAAEALELVQALIAREALRLREIRDGVLFKTEIDDALRTKGVL
jgi:regulator of RNase E activity RraA